MYSNNSSGLKVASTGLAVGSGQYLFVLSGGTAIQTNVGSGGQLSVDSGGTALYTHGNTWVYSGGVTISTIGGELIFGGTSIDGQDTYGGFQAVGYGGTAISAQVYSSGIQQVSAAITQETFVYSTGTEVDLGGGYASNTVVASGGTNDVASGYSNFTQVNSGGTEWVFPAGISTSATINGGGTQIDAGIASATQVKGGGYLRVSSGGATRSAMLSGGGFEIVSNGGAASATTVADGGSLQISSGGKDAFAVVQGGSGVIVSGGGTAAADQINPGASEYVLNGGVAINDAIEVLLSVRIETSDAAEYHEVVATELAPHPFDVAIGRVDAPSQSFVRLAAASAGAGLRDVWTFGYPESAHSRSPDGHLRVGHRALKGYVVRRLRGDELAYPFAPGFELNFPIPSAMSGAPVVLERPATPLEHALMAAPGMVPKIGMAMIDVRSMPKHALHLIGVCVATTEAETVASSFTEVVDGNTTFRETRSKIELFGLANDLSALADWKPACLGDAPLAQAVEPT